MKKVADRIVERLAVGLMIVLLIAHAAMWDVLISPEWKGIPIPVFLSSIILLSLFLFFVSKRRA